MCLSKHLLMTALAMILMNISAHAQFSLGIKGGINLSQINTDNYSKSTLAGYQVGAFARIGNDFYLQPELYLGSSGGKFDTDQSGTDYSAKIRFTTLNLPLLLGKSFGTKELNFRLMAGPIYSYALNTDQTFSNNINGAYYDFGTFNKSTLGYQVGAGFDLGNLTADLRYEGGLTDVSSGYGKRQNLWALSVGFKLF
jgi:hypothetical protein